MVIGKLTQVDSEFQVDIQDINFFPMSIANLESSSSSTGGSVSSLYSWSEQTSGRMSAQAMANASSNTNRNPLTDPSPNVSPLPLPSNTDNNHVQQQKI